MSKENLCQKWIKKISVQIFYRRLIEAYESLTSLDVKGKKNDGKKNHEHRDVNCVDN